MILSNLIAHLEQFHAREFRGDPAHGIDHCRRVFRIASNIADKYDHDRNAIAIGSYLHDIVSFKKGKLRTARRSKTESSRIAEQFFLDFREISHLQDIIFDTIRYHSFSQKSIPIYIEGRIIQDADKIDALGYMGIARLFHVSGNMKSRILCDDDPLCLYRRPQDSNYAVDHVFTKLVKIPDQMNTEYGREIAQARLRTVLDFAENLAREAGGEFNGCRPTIFP
jgi:uncharacterized protein